MKQQEEKVTEKNRTIWGRITIIEIYTVFFELQDPKGTEIN